MTPTALPHDELGAGPAVILLHAGIGDRTMWAEHLRPLADAGRRAIAIDMPEYPCAAEESQGGSCFDLESGHVVCGVARRRTPRYTYPAGLPEPVKSGTRIIGYFRVNF